MDLQITFLGTSNAIPTTARNHPSVVLEYGPETILIDCGEGTQRQFKKANLNPCKLTRILLTHLHGDHSFGLPGLLATLQMSEYSKTLKIYGPHGTKRHVDLLQQLYGKFTIKYEVHESPFTINEKEFEILTAPMVHGLPTLAYSFVIKDKLRIDKAKLAKLKLPNTPLLAKLTEGKDIVVNKKKIKSKSITYLQPGKKVTIVMDTRYNDKAIALAKNSDLLICESTYANDEKKYAEEYKHLTAEQAATIAKKSKSKQLALTHIAQRYEHQPERILSEARKVFKHVSIPKDLDKITI